MKYAILAAGEGSRLADEGVKEPKPLVRVNGEPLIDRLIRVFGDCDAEEVVVICNTLRPETHEYLQMLRQESRTPLRVIQQTTPSSMHSLAVLAPYLRGSRFIATTVDTIFSEREFAAYAKAFADSQADAFMGVTAFVDDEKPLWIESDGTRITAFRDQNADGACRHVSAGIYGLGDHCLDTLERCLASGQSRMRNFQRQLIADGLDVQAFPLTHVLDIDHASDIAKAEQQIAEWQTLFA